MSKDYKGALYFLMTETHEYNGGKIIPIAQNAIDDLQELVDRNEPMKVELVKHYFGYGYYACPKCEQIIIEEHYNYCPDCGQKLDWGN